jgi:hypothetical protein
LVRRQPPVFDALTELVNDGAQDDRILGVKLSCLTVGDFVARNEEAPCRARGRCSKRFARDQRDELIPSFDDGLHLKKPGKHVAV